MANQNRNQTRTNRSDSRAQRPKSLYATSRRHTPGTRVKLPKGTCFLLPSMPFPADSDAAPGERNAHPFIVLATTEDMVLAVMAQTLECPDEGKFNRRKFDRLDIGVELRDPCPPMQPNERRTQYVDASCAYVIPKKLLLDAPDLRICQDGANGVPNPVLRESKAVGYDPDTKKERLMTQVEDLIASHKQAKAAKILRVQYVAENPDEPGRLYASRRPVYKAKDPDLSVKDYKPDPICEKLRANRGNPPAPSRNQSRQKGGPEY